MDRYHSYSPRRNTILPGPLDGTIHQMLSLEMLSFLYTESQLSSPDKAKQKADSIGEQREPF